MLDRHRPERRPIAVPTGHVCSRAVVFIGRNLHRAPPQCWAAVRRGELSVARRIGIDRGSVGVTRITGAAGESQNGDGRQLVLPSPP